MNLYTCRRKRSAGSSPSDTNTLLAIIWTGGLSFSPKHTEWKPGRPKFPLCSHQRMDRNINTKNEDHAGYLFLTFSTWKTGKGSPRRILLRVAKQTNKQTNTGFIWDIYNFSLLQLFQPYIALLHDKLQHPHQINDTFYDLSIFKLKSEEILNTLESQHCLWPSGPLDLVSP